jgi:hypothetical protein
MVVAPTLSCMRWYGPGGEGSGIRNYPYPSPLALGNGGPFQAAQLIHLWSGGDAS